MANKKARKKTMKNDDNFLGLDIRIFGAIVLLAFVLLLIYGGK